MSVILLIIEEGLDVVYQESLPELYRHFQAENFDTSVYSASWFLTLFANQFPLSIVCRMMDLFLSEVIIY